MKPLQSPSQSSRRSRESGAAIVITVIFLSAITLLVISYLSSMRLELKSSASFEETQRTKMIAQGALNLAIERLRNIPEPGGIDRHEGNEVIRIQSSSSLPPGAKGNDYEIVQTNNPVLDSANWTINPGLLTIFDESGSPNEIDLHTGAAASSSDFESVDLNEPVPGDSFPAITWAFDSAGQPNPAADRPEMRIKWQPLHEDPSSAPSQANPMIGRYAFWIDDECAKLNFNMALGKPHSSAAAVLPGDGRNTFVNQFDEQHWPPLFIKGWYATENFNNAATSTRRRTWALGKPQSVNYDVLFDDLDHRAWLSHDVHDHVFLHGFNRYPEALLTFIDEDHLGSSGWHGGDAKAWYEGQRFNSTFYSRGPEFNVFGKSRWFTTYIPLSLEGGPLYQQPFMYNSSETYNSRNMNAITEDYVLHLGALMGTIGFHFGTKDDTDQSVTADNFVTRQQILQLYRYLSRDWPIPGGGGKSFIDKYGEAGTMQLCINMLWAARTAMAEMNTSNVDRFTNAWGHRTTSVNYAPNQDERRGNFPERSYWRFDLGDGKKQEVFLPQSPGPHLTEIKLKLWGERIPKRPGKYEIHYQFDSEYYIHPWGPGLNLAYYPFKLDYLQLRVGNRNHEFGPPSGLPGSVNPLRAARNWNNGNNLGRLQGLPAGVIDPVGYGGSGSNQNRKVVLGSSVRVTTSGWDARNSRPAQVYNGGSVPVSGRFRCGIGFSNEKRLRQGDRPVCMAPLGEEEVHTIQLPDGLSVNPLINSRGNPVEVTFEINDPRLGIHAREWIATIGAGTMGARNTMEPSETSTEKSKFRQHQRSSRGNENRHDEYNSRSRVSSPAYFSILHTGMHPDRSSGLLHPWRTLDLGGGAGAQEQPSAGPPDYCILDLLGGTYPIAHNQWTAERSQPDTYSAPSYMASTFGQVNLNSRIFPDSAFFDAPKRTKPIEGIFRHIPGWSDTDVATIADDVLSYQNGNERFEFVGELSEVASAMSGSTQEEREELIRNMWGCMTTKSNTFGVWGAAQSLKKGKNNTNMSTFEDGDRIQGEKRFYALVERYVWPGKDGIPGNGHLDSSGKWNKMAKNANVISTANTGTDTLFSLPGSPPLRRTSNANTGVEHPRLQLARKGQGESHYAKLDGPQKVGFDEFTATALGEIQSHDTTSIEDAYNPPQPVIKYRVVYFKYLDE